MHWLPLMLADRVGVIEGVADDLASGHISNIFSEMGWKAEWKHNRKGLLTKLAIGAAAAAAGAALLSRRRSRNTQSNGHLVEDGRDAHYGRLAADSYTYGRNM